MNNALSTAVEPVLAQVRDARKLTRDEMKAIVDGGPYTGGRSRG